MIINNSGDKATIEEGLQQDSGYPYEKRPDKRPLLYFFYYHTKVGFGWLSIFSTFLSILLSFVSDQEN